MPPPIRRRFTLLDGMGLIAALAAGFTLVRILNLSDYDGGYWELLVFSRITLFLSPVAVVLITLRLRPPRPNIRKLMRQPGIQAGFAVGFGLVFGSPENLLTILISWSHPSFAAARPMSLIVMAQRLPVMTGSSVAIVWAATQLAPVRRPEKSWFDRGLRVVGWAYISTWLVQTASLTWLYLQ